MGTALHKVADVYERSAKRSSPFNKRLLSEVNIHKTYSFAVMCAYTQRPKLRCQFVYLFFLLLFPFCTEYIKWKSLKLLMLKQTDHDADNTFLAPYQQTLVIYITSYKKVVTFKFLFAAKSRFLKYFVLINLCPLPP